MEKRTWRYIQRPAIHEMPPCSCGNMETQWSEYKNHLWCDKCQKDFIPEHNGIFGQPIPINISRMLGFSFDKFNIETEQVEVLDEFILPIGKLSYIQCMRLEQFFKTNKQEINIKFTSKNEKENRNVLNIVKGILYFNNGEIQLELNEELTQNNNKDFSTVIKFDYPETKTFNIKLSLNNDNKSFNVKDDEEWEKINYYLLTQSMKYSFVNT